ncbi:hypothetical protein [Nocardia higoensis]|uniref:hypothetical protein n=1 Tax=Nocardia higoensis TaxID=228599 RepID=UPI000309AFD0|nr:hypothetical protein [Nocardia higoensis]
MTGPYDVLLSTLPAGATREAGLPDLDRRPDPWESSMQATCECLSWRGALDNLERRHAEDALGETIYRDFPVRARSAVVTAHELLERGVISPDELRARMDMVRDRFLRE